MRQDIALGMGQALRSPPSDRLLRFPHGYAVGETPRSGWIRRNLPFRDCNIRNADLLFRSLVSKTHCAKR